MTTAAIQIKIMPESVDTDLAELESKVTSALKKEGAKINKTEIQEIAFGLKAIIITFSWLESKDTSIIENIKVPGLNSIQIIDYRRAFG